MAIRITGMNSGLDTDSIITELVKAKSAKVDKLKKSQTKLQVRQDAFKELNAKIVKLYNNSITDLSLKSAYMKKKTDVSNSNAVSVSTSSSAMNSTQKLKIKTLATSGYLTGDKVEKTDGSKVEGSTKLTDLGIQAGSSFDVNVGDQKTKITISSTTTMSELASQLKSAGLEASFDAGNGRLYIGAKDSGVDGDFSITASTASGTDALRNLGILVYDETSLSEYATYANMDTDPAAKQTELDRLVAERLASYKAQDAKLTSDIDAKKTQLTKVEDEFQSGYGEDLAELVNNVGGALDTLKQDIADLEAIDEADRTDQEKSDLAEKGKISFVDGYNQITTDTAALEAEQAQVQQYFSGDTATDILKDETAALLDEKIAVALDTINNKDSIQGSAGANKLVGADAEIELNGIVYKAAANIFDINGLTIECKEETGDNEITLTTKDDADGIYDMVKNFIKEYNEIINEMDKLYNAESAKGYEPLTDEEKEAMSESEIEKWETKIKESILRRDPTIQTVSSALKEIMSQGFEVNGKTMYLFDLGVEKAGYFNSEANQKNAFNINGDSDFSSVSSLDNDLLDMINKDPDAVATFFSKMAQTLKDKMFDLMKSTDFSSSYSIYEDKKMKNDYTSYTTKISDAEKKLKTYEDKWYSKFTSMETALARMQSNASAITGLLGG